MLTITGRSPKSAKVRSRSANTQSETGLAVVIRETTRLWRKHGLGYDQTKYVVEHVAASLPWHRPPDVDAASIVWTALKSNA